MWDCINPTRLYETNKNCPTITSIKKASQGDAFFIIRNYVPTLMNEETEKTIRRSSSTRSHLASSTGKFETQARTLGMRLALRGCCRPKLQQISPI